MTELQVTFGVHDVNTKHGVVRVWSDTRFNTHADAELRRLAKPMDAIEDVTVHGEYLVIECNIARENELDANQLKKVANSFTRKVRSWAKKLDELDIIRFTGAIDSKPAMATSSTGGMYTHNE